MKEFAELNPVIIAAETREQQLKSVLGHDRGGAMQDMIRIRRDGDNTNFHLDPTTKFLERITLTAR